MTDRNPTVEGWRQYLADQAEDICRGANAATVKIELTWLGGPPLSAEYHQTPR